MLSVDRPASAPRPSRRDFLRYTGAASAGVALLLAGCKSSTTDGDPTPAPAPGQATVGLGAGDVALLNLLQAGRQLTTALLAAIIAAPPADLPAAELTLLTAIRDHETLHRDFLPVVVNTLRAANNPNSLALAALTPTFSALTLNTRAGALGALRTLLDLVGAGHTGSYRYLSRPVLITLSARMAAVTQRHTAAVADLLTPAAVLDAPDATAPALGRLLRPSALIAAINPYLADGSKLLTGTLV